MKDRKGNTQREREREKFSKRIERRKNEENWWDHVSQLTREWTAGSEKSNYMKNFLWTSVTLEESSSCQGDNADIFPIKLAYQYSRDMWPFFNHFWPWSESFRQKFHQNHHQNCTTLIFVRRGSFDRNVFPSGNFPSSVSDASWISGLRKLDDTTFKIATKIETPRDRVDLRKATDVSSWKCWNNRFSLISMTEVIL